jgi:hypothetical protein
LSFCSFLYWVPAGIVGVVGGGLNTFFCYILYNYIYNYIYIYTMCPADTATAGSWAGVGLVN